MKRVNFILFFILFFSWAHATTYLIQPGGSGAAWSGVSGTVVDLSSPALSLNGWYKATAITSADQIWIIKGTYTLTDSIVTKSTEKIYGGFLGTETTIGDRTKGTNAWDFTNETIIDGNALVRGIVSTTGATIDGLSIQNCAYPSTSVGGNAAAVKITSSSILQNCIVRNNTITGPAIAGGLYAGGVYLTTGAKLLYSYVHHNSCANASGGGNGGGVTIYQLATVDGCTISNNTAYNSGGGVNIIAKTGGAVVNNCIISNNTTTNGSGGGVNAGSGAAFTAGLSLTISNCTISSNTAKINGGGMFLDVTNNGWEGNPINVTKCIISSNTATGTTGSTGNGGGLYLSRGIFNVSGCTINSNISTANTTTDNNGGGGIFTTYSNGSTLYLSNSVLKGNIIGTGKNVGSALNPDMASTTVRNCLITGNIGATFHTQGYGRLCTYQNCTIAGNVTSTGGEAGLYLGSGVNGISTFTNCLFYKSSTNPISGTISGNNNPIVTYCGFDLAAVPVTYMTKTGCITGLTAASFTDAANDDWSLSPTSAAINAGTTIPAITTDITGTLRPQGTGYDIGAYETPSAISSFTPTSGVSGTTVTITGTNLTGATAVSFGGIAASSFVVNTDTQITAVVGLGGTGNVCVTTPGGIGTLAGFTCTGYLPAPVITSYTPLSGASGISVTITGTNLTGATAVSFGGIAAKSITSNSATQIIAKTNSASVGIVSVTTPSGTASLGAPTITSFTPTTAGYTASVVITGTFLTGTSAVKFGGTAPISYIVNSDTQITAILSSGTSGNVTVTTPLGTGTLAGFVWLSPTISSFTPTSGVSGTSIVITGTNLTGATAVSFGSTAASSFLVNSDTQITAEVSGTVTQGNVSVTTPYGTAYRNGFNTAPVISSFTPASAGNGISVIINGSYFSEATAVKFGNNAASSFVINSDNKITAIVGSGSTGSVYVTTGGGTGSKTGFTWLVAPTISSFSPTVGGSGTSVVITGTLLTGATAVSFGGTAATSFVVNSATQITAIVGSGTTGIVSVTTPGGTGTRSGFTSLAPTISSLTPASAGVNATVVISGTGFTGATAVSFGSTPASSFIINSDTQITAIVGSGTTGSVSVTTANGIGTKAGFIWLEAPQSVSNVQNSSALTLTSGSIVNVLNGGELTINGNTAINTINVNSGGKVTISDTQSLTVSGDLNIISDATGTGTFVDYNPNGGLTINGSANVQQYLTGKTGASTRAYWYLSSPVSAATSGVFNVAGTINKLTYYDETIPGYVTQLATNEVTLTKGLGYVTYIGGADAAYTFSTNTGAANAKLNTGTITLNPTRTGTTAAKRGFNLIGNPYPSFLDWNAVVKTNVGSTIWYRSYTGSVMQFDTFDGTYGTGLGVNGVVSQYIPPMQAFWVRVSADGLTGSLVLNNTMRSHQNQNQVNRLRVPSSAHSPVLRLKVSNGENGDEALLVANPDATDGLDAYDSPKMTNDNATIPEIYTLANNQEIVINNLNAISSGKELALGFRTGTSNVFTIKATQISNFDTDTKIILKDNLLTSEQDITDGTPYSFESDATDTSSRFSILFKSKSGTNGVDKNVDANLIMYIYKNTTNQIVINCNEAMGTQGMITVSNALGQKLVQTFTTGTSTVITKSFGTGVYFVTVNVAGKNCTKKIIIN